MSLRLGIVGAGGWLGGAIARSALGAGLVVPTDLTLSYRSKPPQVTDAVRTTQDNRELAERSDVIILSVRPEDWASLELDASGKLVISVMAGIRLARIAAHHGTTRVVRTLPNAAVELGFSYTPFFAADGAKATDRELARRLFECCGTVDEVASEEQLDYLSGLTGTGPAYPALVALAMERDAIARGFDPAVAARAVRALFVGTGRMLEAGSESSAEIVETFMAYRGVTAAGLDAMRESGLEAAIGAGLAAAWARTAAMSRD